MTPGDQDDGIRADTELREKLHERLNDGYYLGEGDYQRGVVACLRWALGELGVSPVTEQPAAQVPDERAATREQHRAYAAMRGEVAEGQERRSLQYYTGCENALSWIAGRDGL